MNPTQVGSEDLRALNTRPYKMPGSWLLCVIYSVEPVLPLARQHPFHGFQAGSGQFWGAPLHLVNRFELWPRDPLPSWFWASFRLTPISERLRPKKARANQTGELPQPGDYGKRWSAGESGRTKPKTEQKHKRHSEQPESQGAYSDFQGLTARGQSSREILRASKARVIAEKREG